MSSTWKGTTGDWNTASNWTPASVPHLSDTATFADTGATNITLSAQAAPGAINFAANAQAYTFTVSSLAASMVLVGAGITNSSAQTETFSATGSGVIQFANSASAGSTLLTASSGGFVQFFGTTSATNATVQLGDGGALAVETAGNLNLGGLSGLSGSQVVFIAVSSPTPTLTVGALGTNTTFAGSIGEETSSGAVTGSLVKTGAGTLTLSGLNSYSGGTTINAGALAISNNSALGSNGVTLASGAALELEAVTITNTVTGSGNIEVAGADTMPTYTGDATSVFNILGEDNNATTDQLTVTTAPSQFAGIVNVGGTAAGHAVTLIGGADNSIGSFAAMNVFAGSTIDTNGFDQNVASLSGAGVVTNSSATSAFLTINGGASSTFSGTITGAALKLRQDGTGTLTLTGVNTFQGPAIVSTGTLALSGAGSISNAVAVEIAANATFDISAANGGASIRGLTDSGSGGSVVLGAQTLTLSNAPGGTFSGVISGSGGLKLSGGEQVLAGANTYQGGTIITSGSLDLDHATSGVIDAAATGQIKLGDGTLLLEQAGTLNNTIHTNGSALSNISASSGETVTLAGTGLSFEVGTPDLQFGSAANNGTIVMSEATASIGGAFNEIEVAGGVLRAGNGLILNFYVQNAAATQVDAGATLDLNGFATTIASLQGGSGTTGGSVTNASGVTTTISGGNFAGEIDGGGNVEVAGALTLSGANGYTGQTTIDVGETLTLTGTGAIASSSLVQIASGGKLDISGTTSGASIGGLADSGSADDSVVLGAQTLTLSAASGGTFSGVISGSGGLILLSGTKILAGANTYTGVTSVKGGSLEIQNVKALGGAAKGTFVFAGATLQMDGDGLTFAEPLALVGAGANVATLNLNDTGFSGDFLTGAITLNGNARIEDIDGNGVGFEIDSTISGANKNLIIGGAGDLTVNGVIATGAGTVTKDGSGTVLLAGANSYTGVTTVNSGVLQTQSGAGAVVVNAPGNLVLLNSETFGSISGSGTLYLEAATLTTGGDGTSTTYSGLVADGDAGDIGGLTKTGAGTLTFTGANTYSGGTKITGGAVTATKASSLGSGDVTVNTGSVLNFSTNLSIGGLAGGGQAHSLSSSPVTLTLNADDNVNFSGQFTVSGAFSLVKNGTGNQTLSSANGFGGGKVTINQGTLTLAVSGALGSSAIAFGAGSTATLALASGVNPSGALSNLASTDSIMLIGFDASATESVTGSGSNVTLTVTDGAKSETLAFNQALSTASFGIIQVVNGGDVLSRNNTFSGGGLTFDLAGGAASHLTISNTGGHWDTVDGAGGAVTLNGAQASIVGGGDTIGFNGAATDAVSLYGTNNNYDTVNGSNGSVSLTKAQTSIVGGGDYVYLDGSTSTAASLYNTGAAWDTVTGSNGNVSLTKALASIVGGGDYVYLDTSGLDYASLYNTGGNWDTVTGSNSNIYLTNAQASVVGGGDVISLFGLATNYVSLYNTGGHWDTVNGANAGITLTNAQASVVGGADTVYLKGGGDTVSLYNTNHTYDTVNGANSTIVLNKAQTSVVGGGDTINFDGSGVDVVSLYSTAGAQDIVNAVTGVVSLTSAQAKIVGVNDTIYMNGASTATETLTGSGRDAYIYQQSMGVSTINGFTSSDTIQFSKADFPSVQSLFANNMSSANGNTIIKLDANDQITLTGILPGSLSQSQFSVV